MEIFLSYMRAQTYNKLTRCISETKYLYDKKLRYALGVSQAFLNLSIFFPYTTYSLFFNKSQAAASHT